MVILLDLTAVSPENSSLEFVKQLPSPVMSSAALLGTDHPWFLLSRLPWGVIELRMLQMTLEDPEVAILVFLLALP